MENISLLLGFNVRYNVFLWSKDTYKMHVLYIYHIYKSIQYAYKNQWIYPVHRIFSVFSEKITFCQAIVVFTQRESWLTARLFQPQNYCLLPLSLKKKNFWMNCFTRSFSQLSIYIILKSAWNIIKSVNSPLSRSAEYLNRKLCQTLSKKQCF